MAWVSYDNVNEEMIWSHKPKRSKGLGGMWVKRENTFNWFSLPKGSIKKLIGRELDWNDKPVELK